MGSHDRTHRFLLWRKVQTSRCAPSQSSRCRVALKYPHHRCAKLIESMLANEAGASRRVSVARFPLGDCGFHLLLDCLEVEGCAFLHRREVYCRLRQLSDPPLHVDATPAFTPIKIGDTHV